MGSAPIRSVSLSVPNASAAVPAMLRRLDSEGMPIAGLQMSQPSLDTSS